MKADYYRYIAEFRSGDEKSKAAEEARKAYADAAKVAKDDLAVTRRRANLIFSLVSLISFSKKTDSA